MKRLFVSINTVVDLNNDASPVFEKAVITNLYKIKGLGYDLTLIIDDTLLSKPFIQQAINILNGEFQFNISNVAETISGADKYLVREINGQFLVKNVEGSKLCYDWNNVFALIKSSARKITHT